MNIMIHSLHVQVTSYYKTRPVPNDIRSFLDEVLKECETATDESNWYQCIQKCVDKWLVA